MRSLEADNGVDELQALLYPLDQVPLIEYEPFSGLEIKPEECLEIVGLRHKSGRLLSYSHVVRKVAILSGSLRREGNEPCAGTDKMVFFNRDMHGKFYWSAVYSSQLFIGDDLKIITT